VIDEVGVPGWGVLAVDECLLSSHNCYFVVLGGRT